MRPHPQESSTNRNPRHRADPRHVRGHTLREQRVVHVLEQFLRHPERVEAGHGDQADRKKGIEHPFLDGQLGEWDLLLVDCNN